MSKRDTFKKGIRCETNRQRRTDNAVSLRKDKKEDSLAKRRAANEDQDGAEDAQGSSTDNATSSRTYVIDDIPELMMGLSQYSDLPRQITSLRGFRRLLSIEKNPPVQQCIDIGAVPIFVQLLQSTNQEVSLRTIIRKAKNIPYHFLPKPSPIN